MNLASETRRVVVLGVFACLLGGYAYVTTPEKKTLSGKTEGKTDRPVFDFDPERVMQIDLVFEGIHLVIARTPEGWKKEGTGESVRPDAVDDFLGNLAKLVNLGEVEGGAEQLADYGLQPPVSRLSLQVEGEGTRTLVLGKNNPVSTSLYAQINESPQVVLIGSVINWDMRKLVTAANNANSAG